MLQLSNLEIAYEPYPIGVIAPVFESGLYQEMRRLFPPLELMKFLPKHGSKYSLSEKYNAAQYREYVAQHQLWRDFHKYVKSDDFIFSIIDALRAHKVDVGLHRKSQSLATRWLKLLRNVRRGHLPITRAPLEARFEFAALPAADGYVVPHTDSPGKIITIVITMIEAGVWNPAWGGGTDILKPKDPSDSYNYLNQQLNYDQCDVVRTVNYLPNQAMLFVKTFNSLHGVQPMKGPKGVVRRTLTINIEQDEG